VSKIRELQKQGRYEELWQTCCGFLDLSLEQFMAIQKQFLLEQIELLKRCELGRKVMHGAMPSSVEEFRKQVPLTKYIDYCPELLEKRDDCLPVKPAAWAHTSGRSGEYPFKWVPISPRTWEEMALLMYAAYIFATCRKKGDLSVRPKKFLYATAPAPYTVGVLAYKCEEDFGFKYFPSPRESEQMSFIERLDKGFWMALEEGIDGIYGLTSVLVGIGEKFKNGTSNPKLSSLIKRPRALLRLTKGLIKSKLLGRPMLPKDVWSIKGIACGGTDSYVFRNKIKEMWGVNPLDIYAGTEGLIVAMQTWDFEGMTFIPHLDFLEFIPEIEYFKAKADDSYQPKTVLLDEVKAGEIYEIVITNFHGGIMTRYRAGDMIKITALKNERLGINIPQMAFERRADDLIDLGIIRLTEKVIWKAIENTNIPYADWTARKEVLDGKPTLHLYIELKDNYIASEKGLAKAIYEEIKKLNDGFIHYDLPSFERLADYRPIVTTLLPENTFQNYMLRRQTEGADLANLKPPHINPSDKILHMLGVKPESVPQVETTSITTSPDSVVVSRK
jgi:hypothetical protein